MPDADTKTKPIQEDFIMQVPLLDLRAQYSPLKAEILEAVSELCDSQRFILGPKVEAFEQELAAYCQSGGAVGVTSGSDALLIALMAEKIQPGDEIIIPEPCFVAYPALATMCGAKVVTVQTRKEDSFKLTPEQLKAAITPKTKLLLLSYPSNPTGGVLNEDTYNALCDIARDKGITILADEVYEPFVYEGKELCFFYPEDRNACAKWSMLWDIQRERVMQIEKLRSARRDLEKAESELLSAKQ